MIESGVVGHGETAEPGQRVYEMSRAGRRQALILLLGVIALWVFALWTLVSLFADGVSGAEWVSLILMSALLVVAPIVGWALLEEANSNYHVSDRGITYKSLGGLDLFYKWSDLKAHGQDSRSNVWSRLFVGDDQAARTLDATGVEGAEGESEAETLLVTGTEGEGSGSNAVARILHKLAYGDKLPIHGGIENRDELILALAKR